MYKTQYKCVRFKKITLVKYILIILLFLTGITAQSQEISNELMDQIENFIEEQDENIDLVNLLERLRILSQSKLNLNRVDADELRELRLLSEIQINDLLDHILIYGDLISLEELQSIPSFQLNDIIRLREFVQVNANDRFQMSLPQMLKESRHVAFVKWSRVLQDKKGYLPKDDGTTNYQGDENRVLIRYRNNFENRFRMGFILEKDSGEKYFSANDNLGVDYLSVHAFLKDYSKVLKDVAIGDFTVSLGQGLISHNSFGSGKGALTTQIIRGGRVIRPYSSINENGFMRGIGDTIRHYDNVEVSLFGSHVKRDGNIRTDTLENDEPDLLFSSLQLSGNHRTLSEIEDRKAIGITSIGGSIKYKRRRGHIAVNAVSHSFDRDLQRSPELYNKYRFAGESLTNISLDYNYRYKNFNIFGESAMALNQGQAHMVGLMIGLNRFLSAAIHYRNYAKDYNALLPNAFGETSSNNNENGIYFGLEWQLAKKWKLRTYADFWKHPWLRFTVNRPSTGMEFYTRLDFYLKRQLLIYTQFSHETKLNNYNVDGLATTQIGTQQRYKMRIHLANQFTKGFELRTRAEFSIFKNAIQTSKGFLIYQDFIFKSIASPLSFTSRFAYFDTDDFQSRIFAFENSVLYEFGIPAYFDQGIRYYINLRYRGIRNLTLELRYSKTHLTNRESFSSGNEFIDGDVRSEVKVQVRYGF